MNLKVDWVVDALVSQVRVFERREGRGAVGIRVSVHEPDGPWVAVRLVELFPGVELEIIERRGQPKVLRISFAMEEQ